MQKITPFFWFDGRVREALATYAGLFRDGEVTQGGIAGDGEEPLVGMVRLAGLEIALLNGGPHFQVNPAISLYVGCESVEEIDALWAGLNEGGMALMPLDAYPFAERFGWVQDRFGVSWQLALTGEAQAVTPFMMFTNDVAGKAQEAMTLYTSLFEESGIARIDRHENGMVAMGQFTLAGQPMIANDSPIPHPFTFAEGTSLMINCGSQEEVDHFWDGLIADGGEPSQCGWLKDKYGVSWQVTPTRLMELTGHADPEVAKRATEAMLQMSKIEIDVLEQAVAGTPA